MSNEAQAWLGVIEALRTYMKVTDQEAQLMRLVASEGTEAGPWVYADAVSDDVRSVVLDLADDMIKGVLA